MAACPHLVTCPLFPVFKLRATLRVWQTNYCEADYARCVRYQRSLEGKPSPLNLLPNGQILGAAQGGGR